MEVGILGILHCTNLNGLGGEVISRMTAGRLEPRRWCPPLSLCQSLSLPRSHLPKVIRRLFICISPPSGLDPLHSAQSKGRMNFSADMCAWARVYKTSDVVRRWRSRSVTVAISQGGLKVSQSRSGAVTGPSIPSHSIPLAAEMPIDRRPSSWWTYGKEGGTTIDH